MTKIRNHYRNRKMAIGRRQFALDRPELRAASVAREAPAGVTAMPIKAQDPETQRLISEFLARRGKA